MTSLNEDLLDRAIDHSVDFSRYNNGVVRRIIALLNRTDKDLFEQLTAALDRLPAESFTVERLDMLLQSVRMLNESAYTALNNELGAELKDLVAFESSYQLSLFKNVLPVQVVVAAVNVEQVYSAALSRPMQGRLMKEWAKSLEADKMTRIRDALRMGYVENQTIGQMVTRIRGTRARGYEDGLIEIDRRSAAAVVRTATAHTANFTRQRFYEANESIIKGLKWVSTLDSRTSPVCRARDGEMFPVSSGPRPPAHWNCLPGDALVLSRSGISGVTKRWFDGELVIIKTAKGREIACTPNHPILTSGGWVAAGVIDVGGNVICDGGSEWERSGNSDHQYIPSSIEDEFCAFFASRKMVPMPVPVASEDFHGDGAGSDVAVVGSDWKLSGKIDAPFGKHFTQHRFIDRRFLAFVAPVCDSRLNQRFGLNGSTASSFVGILYKSFAVFWRCVFHPCELLLRSISDMYSTFFQSSCNHRWRSSNCFCNATDSDSCRINGCGRIGVDSNDLPVFRNDSGLAQNSIDYLVTNSEFSGNSGDGHSAIVKRDDICGSQVADIAATVNSVGLENAANVGCCHSEVSGEQFRAFAGRVPADNQRGDALAFDSKLLDSPTNRFATSGKDSLDWVIADSKLAAYILNGSSGPVFADDVIHVERRVFSGHVFNLETGNGFYAANGIITHNCRSCMSPVTKSWREMGIDLDDLPESTRASISGQVPESMTYQDWLRKQSASRQDDILGKSKGLLFRKGELPLTRFVDRAGKELNLTQLREKHADAFRKAGL